MSIPTVMTTPLKTSRAIIDIIPPRVVNATMKIPAIIIPYPVGMSATIFNIIAPPLNWYPTIVVYAIITAIVPSTRAVALYRFSRRSGSVYSAIRRTLPAKKYTRTIPSQAPADIQSWDIPCRYASPAPAIILPEPIHVQTSVPISAQVFTPLPATMKSACVLTNRDL